MVPYNILESVIRTDVNNIKNEEYKKNILRFNQLAGIIDSETVLDEKAMTSELINGGVAEVLGMKDLYQYARGIYGISELNRNNAYAMFLSSIYTQLSYKYRDLYTRSAKIEYIVNVLMEITLNINNDVTYLAYDAAKYVLEYDELNYMDEVLTFLKTLNEYVDRYLLDYHKKIGFNLISSSVHILKGLRKESD